MTRDKQVREQLLLHYHLERLDDEQRSWIESELLRDVWGFRSMGRTCTLDSHASRLRRKLDPDGSRFVFNCWGVGYRLIGG